MSDLVAILAASITCVSLAAAIIGQLRRLTTRLEKRHQQAEGCSSPRPAASPGCRPRSEPGAGFGSPLSLDAGGTRHLPSAPLAPARTTGEHARTDPEHEASHGRA
jgi:hypothetical protein